MMKKRRVSIFATIAIVLIIPLFCLLLSPYTLIAAETKQVTISLGIDIPNTDPHGHMSAAGFSVWQHMMEPLIWLDIDNSSELWS